MTRALGGGHTENDLSPEFRRLGVPMGWAGMVYTAVALVVGGWFIWESHVLQVQAQREDFEDRKAMKVFHLSITYLTLLFIALAVDPFVGAPLMHFGA